MKRKKGGRKERKKQANKESNKEEKEEEAKGKGTMFASSNQFYTFG
jgi:hypothetical protein